MDTILHVRLDDKVVRAMRHYCIEHKMKLGAFIGEAIWARLDDSAVRRIAFESVTPKGVREVKVVKDEYSQE